MEGTPLEGNVGPEETPEEAAQKSKLSETLSAITDNLDIQFVDLIRCDASAEMVVLSLFQSVPPGVGASKRLIARYAITWPHLMRARDLFDRMIAQNKERVLEVFREFHDGSRVTQAE